jgi:hypothetical protein
VEAFHATHISRESLGGVNLKFTIRYDVPREAIVYHVPQFLHGRLKVAPLADPAYTLIVFAHAHVTTSRLAEKAIRRLTGVRGNQVLAIGPGFTVEAREALDSCGAIVITASDYRWTDASYKAIRSVTRTRARYIPSRPAPVVPNEPPSRRPPPTHVYAVLRIDDSEGNLADRITVKEVVTTAALAESEAARLNQLNGSKSCEYVVRLARLYSPGTSAGSNTAHRSPSYAARSSVRTHR